MPILVLTLFASAIGLGAYLLIPGARKRAFVSRPTLTAAHGILGSLALLGYISMLFKTRQSLSTLCLTATGLTIIGFLLGTGIFLLKRFTQSKPDLILTSHVIFAGMGAAVIVALLF